MQELKPFVKPKVTLKTMQSFFSHRLKRFK